MIPLYLVLLYAFLLYEKVIACSGDSCATHEAWVSHQPEIGRESFGKKVPFPMIGDKDNDHYLAKEFGLFDNDLKMTSHAVVVMNRKRQIIYRYIDAEFNMDLDFVKLCHIIKDSMSFYSFSPNIYVQFQTTKKRTSQSKSRRPFRSSLMWKPSQPRATTNLKSTLDTHKPQLKFSWKEPPIWG